MSNQSSLPNGQIIFDPRGTVAAATVALAPRVKTLRGIRLGVLENT